MPADPRTVQRSMLRDAPPPPAWTPNPEPEPPPKLPLTAKQHRARLAETVADFQATADRLAKLNGAHQRAQRDATDAFLAVEQCEALLAEAREDQPKSYVNRILNGADDPPEDLVLAAQRHLDEANRRRGLARQGEAIIGEEIAATERRLASLRYDRRDRIKELVLASPAVAQLHIEWEAALRHAGEIFAKLHLIDPIARTANIVGWEGTAPTVAHPGDAERVRVKVPLGDAAEWRAALQALEVDADAKLPGE